MGILWIIVIGFVAGVIARLLAPGPNKPAGFLLTTGLGIAGAFVATFIGQAVGLVPARPRRGLYRRDPGHHRGAVRVEPDCRVSSGSTRVAATAAKSRSDGNRADAGDVGSLPSSSLWWPVRFRIASASPVWTERGRTVTPARDASTFEGDASTPTNPISRCRGQRPVGFGNRKQSNWFSGRFQQKGDRHEAPASDRQPHRACHARRRLHHRLRLRSSLLRLQPGYAAPGPSYGYYAPARYPAYGYGYPRYGYANPYYSPYSSGPGITFSASFPQGG